MSDTLAILAPALASAWMIALVHTPLGINVLRRGIIFIDLAVAQIAALAVVLTTVFWPQTHSIISQLFTFALALAAAVLFFIIEKKIPKHQEAIIGSCYIVSSSLALLLLSFSAHGAQAFGQLISGDILFVSWRQWFSHLPIYLTVLVLWFGIKRLRQGLGFYVLFALAVTSSVQLAGVYLVFASLIFPALASCQFKNPLLPALATSISASFLGLGVSFYADWPTGPVLVLSLALVSFIVALTVFILTAKQKNV